LTPSNQRNLRILEWQGKRTFWRVSSHENLISLENLRAQKFLIAVSLRNPRFSNAWIRAAATEIVDLSGKIWMCLVDDPYFERVKGSGERNLTDKLATLAEERRAHQRRLEEIASRFPEGTVSLFSWEDVQSSVPLELKEEFHHSFTDDSNVRDSILRQVKITRGENLSDEEMAKSSIFLLAEFPVLTYIYYSYLPLAIDVYPGPQADFFWQLERGRFQETLPLATSMAQGGRGLTYADVSFLLDENIR
jgi:hypothetical protein